MRRAVRNHCASSSFVASLQMDSDPTEEDAPVCAECHLAYDRNANTGQWACRMHPSPARTMHTATLCCGVVAAEVNGMCDALHNPDRASRWEAKEHAETDKAGCVRADHRPPDADRLRWLGAVSVMVPVGTPPRTDALILQRDVNMATLDAAPWKVTVPLAWSAAGAPVTQEWDVTELARHALRQVYAQPCSFTRAATRLAQRPRRLDGAGARLEARPAPGCRRVAPGTRLTRSSTWTGTRPTR